MQIRFLLIFLAGAAQAQADGLYPAAAIPEAMRRNAYAVIRLHETTFTVKSAGEAVEKVHYVVTVLDQKGSGQARHIEFYDRLSKISKLEGTLYDASGKKIRSLKKTDIQDVSVAEGSLFTDNRVKIADFGYVQYPYTVEFETESITTNLMFYPRWFPQNDENVSLEKATLHVVSPANLKIRYKEQKLLKSVQVKEAEGGTHHAWSLESLPAFSGEPQGPFIMELLSGVYLAPTDFAVDGYQGNMASWANMGKFQQQLLAGRDELPENVRQEIIRVTGSETGKTAKIKKVYEYVQSSTRYISVQLGIGGWQPFDAKSVSQNGYGDCKALSNYTKALLKAIGIESHYTVVCAGENQPDFLVDFPSKINSNHVILCVPVEKDTVWLECTSQTNAFGYQGTFTGNRHALVITPTGGKLVKTTRYKASDNVRNRRISVAMDETGNAKATVTSLYTGEQQEDLEYIMHQLGMEDQKKALYKRINIPSFEISRFSLAQKKDRIPSVTETLALTVRQCASKSGTRLFVIPNLMNAASPLPPKAENRQTELVLRSGYQNADTVVYQLPKGYGVEFLPDDVRMESKFGTYAASMRASEGQVSYTRHLTVNRGRYPASAYNEWVDFSKKIAKADKAQIVLVNKGL